jgi:ABC-type microcin C transport system duplicated ATPase subunit YejF
MSRDVAVVERLSHDAWVMCLWRLVEFGSRPAAFEKPRRIVSLPFGRLAEPSAHDDAAPAHSVLP